jgi:hypothetical protein
MISPAFESRIDPQDTVFFSHFFGVDIVVVVLLYRFLSLSRCWASIGVRYGRMEPLRAGCQDFDLELMTPEYIAIARALQSNETLERQLHALGTDLHDCSI